MWRAHGQTARLSAFSVGPVRGVMFVCLLQCDSTVYAPMYVCQLCNHFASFSYDCVLRHIGAVHSHEDGFRVRCGFDSCPRMLTNYHAFRRHLRKKHGYCLKTYSPTIGEEQPGERSTTSNSGAGDESESLGTDPDSQFQHDPLALSEKRSDAMYILKLKEKYKLAQTTVDGILSDTEEIAGRIVSRLQQRVLAILNEAGVDPKEIPGFLEVFEGPEILRPFNGLNTEYLQDKYFRENMGLVVSVSLNDTWSNLCCVHYLEMCCISKGTYTYKRPG